MSKIHCENRKCEWMGENFLCTNPLGVVLLPLKKEDDPKKILCCSFTSLEDK